MAVGNKCKSAFVMKVAADDGVQGALLKQVVAFFVVPLLIGRTRSTQVVEQWLRLGFGGTGQVLR